MPAMTRNITGRGAPFAETAVFAQQGTSPSTIVTLITYVVIETTQLTACLHLCL